MTEHVCSWCHREVGESTCIKYLDVPGCFWCCPDCRRRRADGTGFLPMPNGVGHGGR